MSDHATGPTPTPTDRRNGRIGHRIVEAVAEIEGTHPTELRPPLYDTIDAEALERLFTGDPSVTVHFVYNGHEVTVRGDGAVMIDTTDRPATVN